MTALVTDPLRWWADKAADAPAITFDGRETLSYAEFHAWSDRVAHWLVEQGVAPGDRVGIVGTNTLEWCAGAIGALKAGAVVAAYNHRFVAHELAHLITDSEPTLVLAGAEHVRIVDDAASTATGSFGRLPLAEVAALRTGPERPFPRVEVDPDSPAVLIYTSGTTSLPKGVIFTHRTIFAFILEWRLM
jgi:fatty-acyl-CoA synthase